MRLQYVAKCVKNQIPKHFKGAEKRLDNIKTTISQELCKRDCVDVVCKLMFV